MLKSIVAFLLLAFTFFSATNGLQNVITSTTNNFDGNGTAISNQFAQFDTQGNVVHANGGSGWVQFGKTYYWYGDDQSCGFAYAKSTAWCGFSIYSSTDLKHWTNQGHLFDPNSGTWQTQCLSNGNSGSGCWRLHVIYNASTQLYVLWFANGSATDGFSVFTCTSPIGGCTQQPNPTNLSTGSGNTGDAALFVDTNGTAYLAHVFNLDTFNLTVDQLNTNYTDGVNSGTLALTGHEAVAMFKQGSTYYLTYSNTCAYCTSTGLFYSTASTPLGTWTSGGTLNGSGCGGQQNAVNQWALDGVTTYVYQTDLWNGQGNEALANNFITTLSFNGSTINSFTCAVSTTFTDGFEAPPTTPSSADQTDETANFNNLCDITSTQFRLQTFVPSKNGTVTNVTMPVGKGSENCTPAGGGACQTVNANATVALVTLDGSNNPVSTLASIALTATSLLWSPQEQTLPMNVSVTGGTAYGIEISGANTLGCFTTSYNNNLPYAAGVERVSANSGSTWGTDSGRSLKFSVYLQ
jgi:hypothetical protein